MNSAKQLQENISRIIDTLKSDVETNSSKEYITELKEELDELNHAINSEPDYIQDSVTQTVKTNVVLILSDMPDQMLANVLEETKFTNSFDTQFE